MIGQAPQTDKVAGDRHLPRLQDRPPRQGAADPRRRTSATRPAATSGMNSRRRTSAQAQGPARSAAVPSTAGIGIQRRFASQPPRATRATCATGSTTRSAHSKWSAYSSIYFQTPTPTGASRQLRPSRERQSGRRAPAEGAVFRLARDAKREAGHTHHRSLDLSGEHQKDRVRGGVALRPGGAVSERQIPGRADAAHHVRRPLPGGPGSRAASSLWAWTRAVSTPFPTSGSSRTLKAVATRVRPGGRARQS